MLIWNFLEGKGEDGRIRDIRVKQMSDFDKRWWKLSTQKKALCNLQKHSKTITIM